jgi:hypothetical protein
MSNERSLNQELLRIKRENDRLRARITELESLIPKQPEASKESPAPAKKAFDPWAPTGDAVFDALRSRAGQPKRRSWLNE